MSDIFSAIAPNRHPPRWRPRTRTNIDPLSAVEKVGVAPSAYGKTGNQPWKSAFAMVFSFSGVSSHMPLQAPRDRTSPRLLVLLRLFE
jgi:hypothetical protein